MSDDYDLDPRHEAIKRIKARRDFYQHLAAYVMINAALVLIWATTGQGYFWPGWVLGAWGIGVIFNAWALLAHPISEDDIRREMNRRSHA
jgi:2TM domain-containing protein